ncbi:hypothetical protein O181_128974 [Austropuccinia psidii MF-1]|uniref:Tf2-1-like SH3-like domain-containing protein n=1 Tax=Austropuccinia psidii MF-1 TaxID=1389203 RepID=A0A9Q3KY84_9BASI|nr:hypothetical protein [Austropuccinia psidii MF-1]
MIQSLEDMIRRFCSSALELKDSSCFTHAFRTLIQALGLAYKTSIHSSTGKTPEMLEEDQNPRPAYDTLKKDLVDTHPATSSFKVILDKKRNCANRFMEDSFKYAKERCGKSHKPPHIEVRDFVLVSTLSFNNIKGPKKVKYSFEGPFMIRELCGPNAFKLELTGELMSKHPAFPVSLIKRYSSSDEYLFPLRNKPPLEIPPLEEG